MHDEDVPATAPDTVTVYSAPVLVGAEALAVSPRRSSRLVDKLHAVEAPKAPRRRTVLQTDQAQPMSVPVTSSASSPDVTPHGSHEAAAVPSPDAPKRVRRPHAVPLLSETGRPETGAEFARRMAGKFVLLGPGERKKGGAKNPLTSSNQNDRTDNDPGRTQCQNDC